MTDDTGGAGGATPVWGAPSPPPPPAPIPPPSPQGSATPPPPPALASPQPAAAPYAPGTPTPTTNGLAVASMVLGITGPVVCGIGAILALIFGLVALSQIKAAPGSKGRGMAIAGIVLGSFWIAVGLLILIVALASGGSSNS